MLAHIIVKNNKKVNNKIKTENIKYILQNTIINDIIHEEGRNGMKIDRKKFSIARARACMGQNDFEKAGIPKGTLCRAMSGKGLKPETLGKIAKALGVDVTEIIED